MAYYGRFGDPMAYPGTPAAGMMTPGQPMVVGSAPCPLCFKFHAPQDGCHAQKKHLDHSSSSHRKARRSRREKDSDSSSDQRSKKDHHSRKHSKRRSHKRGKSRSRRGRAGSDDSSELSSSSSDSDSFHPTAMQLIRMGEKISEDVGVKNPHPNITILTTPAASSYEPPPPPLQQLHYNVGGHDYNNFGIQEQVAEHGQPMVNPLEAAYEEEEEKRSGHRARSQHEGNHRMVGSDSQFSSTGYQPVRSPTLPAHARLSAIHPSAAAMQHWQDSPMLSESLPSSRASSIRRSRPSMSRAPSSFAHHPYSSHHGPSGLGQLEALEAALQHKSVSEAAFPLSSSSKQSSRHTARFSPPLVSPPPTAAAASSAGKSRRSQMPSAAEPEEFVPVSVSNSRNFTAVLPGDPRFYTSFENHPYRLSPATHTNRKAPPPVNIMEGHPLAGHDFREGQSNFCAGCFGAGA